MQVRVGGGKRVQTVAMPRSDVVQYAWSPERVVDAAGKIQSGRACGSERHGAVISLDSRWTVAAYAHWGWKRSFLCDPYFVLVEGDA